MDHLKIGWNLIEEQLNIKKWSINFNEASQVIRNSSSFKIRNIARDYIFIGPVNDLSKILLVDCKLEEEFRKIVHARKATQIEENMYFNNLANGGIE